MSSFKLIFSILSLLLLVENWPLSLVSANNLPPGGRVNFNERDGRDGRDGRADSPLMTALNGKSRQLRCVRCYEDRYGDDRSRYADDRSRYADDRSRYADDRSRNTDDRSRYSGYGGYSSRSADERSNWYYPTYDRYRSADRGADRDYDRYYPRDDRYTPRTYDRYEGRGYDRGDSGYSSYDTRDRYGYGDYNRDRYYEPKRQGYGYERDTQDRYYPRYDYRNYRPWDETYSGQSGFDNSGRGYYFAGKTDGRSGGQSGDRRYLPEEPQRTRPCGAHVTSCPYDGGSGRSNANDGTAQVSSRPIDSRGQGGVSNVTPSSAAGSGGSANRNSGWTQLNEDDNSTRGGSSSRDREKEKEKDRDQQSSSYGGRPPRPLGGSYLFDRDSNIVIPEVPTNGGSAAQGNDMSMGKSADNSNGNTQEHRSVSAGSSAAGASSPAGMEKQQ